MWGNVVTNIFLLLLISSSSITKNLEKVTEKCDVAKKDIDEENIAEDDNVEGKNITEEYMTVEAMAQEGVTQSNCFKADEEQTSENTEKEYTTFGEGKNMSLTVAGDTKEGCRFITQDVARTFSCCYSAAARGDSLCDPHRQDTSCRRKDTVKVEENLGACVLRIWNLKLSDSGIYHVVFPGVLADNTFVEVNVVKNDPKIEGEIDTTTHSGNTSEVKDVKWERTDREVDNLLDRATHEERKCEQTGWIAFYVLLVVFLVLVFISVLYIIKSTNRIKEEIFCKFAAMDESMALIVDQGKLQIQDIQVIKKNVESLGERMEGIERILDNRHTGDADSAYSTGHSRIRYSTENIDTIDLTNTYDTPDTIKTTSKADTSKSKNKISAPKNWFRSSKPY